jgi:hypothetical protein
MMPSIALISAGWILSADHSVVALSAAAQSRLIHQNLPVGQLEIRRHDVADPHMHQIRRHARSATARRGAANPRLNPQSLLEQIRSTLRS